MLQMDSVSVRGKSSELETTQELHLLEQSEPQKTNPYSSVPSKWIQDENNLTGGWYVNTSLLHSQGYGRGEQRITHCCYQKNLINLCRFLPKTRSFHHNKFKRHSRPNLPKNKYGYSSPVRSKCKDSQPLKK